METFSGHCVLVFHKHSLQDQTQGKGWGSNSPTDFYFPSVGSMEMGPAWSLFSSPKKKKTLNCDYAVTNLQPKARPSVGNGYQQAKQDGLEYSPPPNYTFLFCFTFLQPLKPTVLDILNINLIILTLLSIYSNGSHP